MAEGRTTAPLSEDLDVRRKMLLILRILADANEPMGSGNIAGELERYGTALSERQVRNHLQLMDDRGLTEPVGQSGRVLTAKGREELGNSMVASRMGFIGARIDRLAYVSSFDVATGKGQVAMNVSLVPLPRLKEALDIIREVVRAGLGFGDRIMIAEEGEALGTTIPPGMAGIGTVCSVTLNGILLRHHIAVDSVYGGLLQTRERTPLRFTELVSYRGSTLDPMQIFISGRMTSVWEAATEGSGKIGASLREIPAVALQRAQQLIDRLATYGLSGVLAVGAPDQPICEMPVGMERAGLVVVGGLTPLAAVLERGIEVTNLPMHTTCDYSMLRPVFHV
ncbi:MAG: DUF128 domain-containing protein [Armatimonadia bacterium]|nr:DUF128 domain-containing protein [Armatimonadia bacterium]